MTGREKKLIFDIDSGRELSGVVFVRDYLQLLFDWATITFNVFPIVEVDGRSYELNQPEYRDKLCGQIGKQVNEIFERNDQVTISFFDQSSISISREMNVLDLPEVVVFEDDSHPIQIW